jgi:hypothetical protein
MLRTPRNTDYVKLVNHSLRIADQLSNGIILYDYGLMIILSEVIITYVALTDLLSTPLTLYNFSRSVNRPQFDCRDITRLKQCKGC